MANTKNYLSHLLQNTGITPACSEEERAASEVIAKVFEDHGFEPEIQEFSASGSAKIVQAGLGIVLFIGAVLMGLGGVAGFVGLLLVAVVAVVYTLERMGRPVLSQTGSVGLSQNVIAHHKASGPLASPRNRPVVVVAHYDSPRVDLLSKAPFASYRPMMVKLLPFAMLAPIVAAVARLLPFPDAAKVVLWIIAIVASLVPLANAIAIIANRFVLPYTTGAVCNMSSVAAMLGVMDAVAPYELGEEFTSDMPADEYFAEQHRILEEALAAAGATSAAETAYPHELVEVPETGAVSAEQAIESGEVDPFSIIPGEFGAVEIIPSEGAVSAAESVVAEEVAASSTMSMDVDAVVLEGAPEAEDVETEAEAEPESELPEAEATLVGMPAIDDVEPLPEDAEQGEIDFEASDEADADSDESDDGTSFQINAEGNVRFGAKTLRSLGMLPASCVFVYENDEVEEVIEHTAFDVAHEPIEPFSEDEQPVDEEASTNAEEELPVVEDAEPEPEDEPVDDEVADEPETVEAEAEVESADEAASEPVAEADDSVEADEPAVEDDADQVAAPAEEPAADALGGTVMMSSQPVETVDSLMAQISRDIPAPTASQAPALETPQQRLMNLPSTADAPAPRTPAAANRASLFDLPDPSATPVDPFAVPGERAAAPVADDVSASDPYAAFVPAETAPVTPASEKPHGLSRLFGRKKKTEDSMGAWLDVDDSFDAKTAGSDIGSWDNFEDDGWKGGAAGFDGENEEELREAIADMGDDELLGHDIWFVATGASENDHAGMRAFLEAHRPDLRGVFLINLESVGAGQVVALSTEGEQRVFKGDKRIINLVQRVSSDFHHQYGTVDMPYVTTDAHVAMEMSLRSLTLGGVDATGFALSHTENDQPYNVNLENVSIVSDVVTEVIRRS